MLINILNINCIDLSQCVLLTSMIKHGEYQNLLTLSKIIGYKYVLNLFVP